MASARGMRVGGAFVELGVNDRLAAALKRAQARLQSFAKAARQIGLAITAAGSAITGSLLLAVRHFARAGDEIEKMSRRTGFSAEALSELGFAAEQSGASIADLENSLRGMQRALGAAARGGSIQVDALKAIGLSFEAISELAPEDQFTAIAEGLSRIEDPTRRAALAMDLFGRSGTAMLPMIDQGARGIMELREQARALGLTIDADAAGSAAILTDRLNEMRRSTRAVVFQIGGALAPIISELSKSVTRAASIASKWVKENQGVVIIAAKVGVALTAAGTAIVVLGISASVAALAVGGLIKLLVLLKAVALLALSPIVLITAALAAGVIALARYTDAGRNATKTLMQAFGEFGRFASGVFSGIADALRAGDTPLAAEILWLALKVIWQRGVNELTEIWRAIRADMISTATDVFFGVVDVVGGAVEAILSAWAGMAATIRTIMSDVFHWIERQFGAVTDFVAKGLIEVQRFFGVLSDSEADAAIGEISGDARRRDAGSRRSANERRAQIEAETEAARERNAELRRLATESIRRAADTVGGGLATAEEIALRESERRLREAEQALDDARERAKQERDVADSRFNAMFGDDFDSASSTVSSSGTASGFVAARAGVFGGRTDKIADATAKTAKNTERITQRLDRIDRSLANGGLMFS